MLNADGRPFGYPEAYRAVFDVINIKTNVKKGIPVVEIININDPGFAFKAVEMIPDLIRQAKQ